MDINEKINILIVTGPTASGKTSLGVLLAQYFDGEIVSADSMQIYRGMKIGTATATDQEMCGITHHLLGFVDPKCQYSVSEYKKDATKVINEIVARKKLPIIVGGTGLYIDSLVYELDFTAASEDEHIRQKWHEYNDKYGPSALHERLAEVDPISAQRLHENDIKRVIRALEVYEITGVAMSSQAIGKTVSSKFSPTIISLECKNREYLYDRINKRVDIMIRNGLVEEVKSLIKQNVPIDAQSMKAIGYRQIIPCIISGADINSAIEEVKMESRRYAKRQLTWMRRRDCIRIDIEGKSSEALAAEALQELAAHGYIVERGIN